MRKITSVVCTTAFAVLVALPAFAQSSKAAWRFQEVIDLAAAASTEPTTQSDNDTGWKDILTTHIKTPNAKEIAIGASLQCGLVTDTTVRSKNGDLDSSAARGKIAVRIKLVTPAGETVYAQPSNGTDLDTDIPLNGDGVTYCDRYQKLAARFSGLNCTVTDTGGITCADPEELQLVLKTLNAHHFNFIYANATPGVHTVSVQARAQAGVELGCLSATAGVTCTPAGSAGAAAFAGAGAMSVEVIRLVKDADGTTDLDTLR